MPLCEHGWLFVEAKLIHHRLKVAAHRARKCDCRFFQYIRSMRTSPVSQRVGGGMVGDLHLIPAGVIPSIQMLGLSVAAPMGEYQTSIASSA